VVASAVGPQRGKIRALLWRRWERRRRRQQQQQQHVLRRSLGSELLRNLIVWEKWWKDSGDKPVRVLSGHGGDVNDCSFYQGSRHIISCSKDKTVRIWDLEPEEEGLGPVRTVAFPGHNDTVLGCALFMDETRAMTVSGDRTLKIWDLGRRQRETELLIQIRRAKQGESVAAATEAELEGPTVKQLTKQLSKVSAKRCTCTIMVQNKEKPTSVAVLPDDLRLLVITNKAPQIISLATGDVLQSIKGLTSTINACCL
jgi:WD40 repeat protein